MSDEMAEPEDAKDRFGIHAADRAGILRRFVAGSRTLSRVAKSCPRR